MQRRIVLSLGLAGLVALGALGDSQGRSPDRLKEGKAVTVREWRVADPITYENLSVFPVVARQWADTSAFVTLDEALARGEAVVTESGGEIIRRTRDGWPAPLSVPQGGAQVNQLVLIHRGSKPLVLLAGEVVTGGKQDRVVAKDRVVPPGAEPLPLDVFCVERGRWAGASAQFAAAKVMVHPSVREKAAVDKDQSEVWAAVRSGSTASGGVVGGVAASAPAAISGDTLGRVIASEAQSESYIKVYQRSRVGQSVESFAEEVERRFVRATRELKGERVVGVIIAYGGEVAWADAFGSAELFAGYWPKLLRSYVVEALARPGSQEHATLEDAREFLRGLEGRESVESEPGVYRWRQVAEGRYAEIELTALAPKALMLHWVKIRRTS